MERAREAIEKARFAIIIFICNQMQGEFFCTRGGHVLRESTVKAGVGKENGNYDIR